MSKKGGKKGDVEMDPIFTTVQQSMEETVTYFMKHLPDYLHRYSQKLKIAMPHNPKACHYYYDPAEDEEAARKRFEDAQSSPRTGRSHKHFMEQKNKSNEDAKGGSDDNDGKIDGVPAEEGSGPLKTKRSDRSPSPVSKKVPTSPLLRRPKLDPALEAEMLAQPSLNMYSPVAPGQGAEFKFPSANAVANAEAKGTSPVNSKAAAASTADDKKDGDNKKASNEEAKKKGEEEEISEKELWAQLVPPPNLLKELSCIKMEARLLWKTFDRIHDWLAFNIPTMKEEDNSGVSVMGAVIQEVSEIIGLARAVYNMELKYLSDRSEIENKVVKYQGADSYHKGLAVYDANTWDDIERGWRSLMRGVLLVHSVLAKNMKVLKEPRKKSVNYMLAM